MANSELYGKNFEVPKNVLDYISKQILMYPKSDGIKRAKFLLNNKSVTYQTLKRLKNFFDEIDTTQNDSIQYRLAGGDLMKNFVNSTLDEKRDAIKKSKKHRSDMSVDVNLGTKPTEIPRTGAL